jgi:SAM-dependent methyltransferase
MARSRPMTREDYTEPFTEKELRAGAHRKRAGGLWDELGRRQLDYLSARGLERTSRFLDVGCGPLRGGIHFARYLDPGCYFGIDVNESLLDAGYELELTPELRSKLPRDHLRATDRFDCDFGVEFDFVLAHSLFTHLPLNDIRLCLHRVAEQTKVGGRFFATFFEAPADFPVDGILDAPKKIEPGARRTGKHPDRNPFWYWPGDLEWAASFSPWQFRYIGDWGHPRRQNMVEFLRTP